MPSAAPDAAVRARFAADHEALLARAGLAVEASVGVALSGGPDSLALLLLARSCARGTVQAMTVDHGLRPEAATEAAAMTALCASLDIPHTVERLALDKPGQATARAGRYAALAGWAEHAGLAAILTAHHADDQAETMLMRLARGAGVAGLSGIRAIRPLTVATVVLRPLLSWRKSELEAIVAAAGLVAVRDPSNDDPRYDRTAARGLLAEAPWLDPRRLAASAAYLAEAERALAAIADARYRIGTPADGLSAFVPDPDREIARRQLRRLFVERFDAHPDGRAIDRAIAALTGGGGTTCADILCRADGGTWTFRRAPPRRMPG